MSRAGDTFIPALATDLAIPEIKITSHHSAIPDLEAVRDLD
jgi:hypothetical protein